MPINTEVMNKIADEALAADAKKRLPSKSEQDKYFRDLIGKAHEAGLDAGFACRPTPMIVTDEVRKQSWRVDGGACGFAWITFKGNTTFGRWASKATGLPCGRIGDGYPTGKQVWVSEFGQSVDRKEAYARAFAKVLRDGGVTDAYAGSRLD